MAVVVVLAGATTVAAQEVSGVATASSAAAGLEHTDGNRTIRLERDSEGRWIRVETTRIELVRVRPRTSRFKMSLYRAPASAEAAQLRSAGQKLANRERGTVAIIYDGTEVMAFAPTRTR